MAKFLIPLQRPNHYSRVYDNAFLWNDGKVYIMSGHRLALWCWLQCERIFDRKHVLVHIDQHTDARAWEGPGEPECLEEILKNFPSLKDSNVFESMQCLRRDPKPDRDTRPCITYDNFIHLAAKANLFRHYYIYSSDGDWKPGISRDMYTHRRKISDVHKFIDSIKNNPNECILDIDLDFFDNRFYYPGWVYRNRFIEKICDWFVKNYNFLLLRKTLKTLARHVDHVSMITIAINDVPGDTFWNIRQRQLLLIKKILNLEIPIPIIPDGIFDEAESEKDF